jgi:pyruvate/2-oxoglutarate dehydrogenase complex dihydrolipoamide acyltransferase (E2) component
VARELTMPKLSDSMADAVIVRWLKGAGESFARGEALIEVETDKATVVYEAESDGTLDSILVPEGETVAVGEPIATVANGERLGSDPAGVRPQKFGYRRTVFSASNASTRQREARRQRSLQPRMRASSLSSGRLTRSSSVHASRSC